MDVQIRIDTVDLTVTGRYTKAEPDVGLQESFEIRYIFVEGKADISGLLLWAESKGKYHGALAEIEELCLEKLRP